jgi:transcriptional regulator with XRE-family HTH domain
MIFNDLGVTQQQYAVRTNYDKSYVSRFLNGRRVATQDFIDRLLLEIEKHRKVPITGQTRERLRQLRSCALRAYDPEIYRLEILRDEVDKSHREVKRLLVHQEALESLLERREGEVEELRTEMMQLQSDWVADRVQSETELLVARGENHRYSDERGELLEEIARLKEELRNTVEQKELAEQRCAVLEQQVESTESAVAERRDQDGVEDVSAPIEDTYERLRWANDVEAHRELAEFSISRSSGDVAKLCIWLRKELESDYASQLATDYCRQRSVESVARFALEIENLDDPKRDDQSLSTAVMRVIARRGIEDLLRVCEILAESCPADSPKRRRFLPFKNLTYTWLTHGTKGSDRHQSLLRIIDHLDSLGQGEASTSLIGRLAATSRVDTYARVLSDSGREREAQLYAASWLRRMKGHVSPHQLVRNVKQMCAWPNPLMADVVFSEMWNFLTPQDFAWVLLRLLEDDQKLHGQFAQRLVREMAVAGRVGDVVEVLIGAYSEGSGKGALVPPVVADMIALLRQVDKEAAEQRSL